LGGVVNPVQFAQKRETNGNVFGGTFASSPSTYLVHSRVQFFWGELDRYETKEQAEAKREASSNRQTWFLGYN